MLLNQTLTPFSDVFEPAIKLSVDDFSIVKDKRTVLKNQTGHFVVKHHQLGHIHCFLHVGKSQYFRPYCEVFISQRMALHLNIFKSLGNKVSDLLVCSDIFLEVIAELSRDFGRSHIDFSVESLEVINRPRSLLDGAPQYLQLHLFNAWLLQELHHEVTPSQDLRLCQTVQESGIILRLFPQLFRSSFFLSIHFGNRGDNSLRISPNQVVPERLEV